MTTATDWGYDSNMSFDKALSGGLLSIFSPSGGAYISARDSRLAQEAAIQKQHEWEVEENQKDREWQEKMFGLSNDEWTRRFDYENDYSAQAARLRAAGINPSAFFGNGQSGVASPSSPTYSAGSHSLSSLGLPAASASGGASIFSTVAQLMDSYSKLKSTDLAEQRQKATLGAEVDKIISEASRNYSESALTDVLRSIKEAYGKTHEAYELCKMVADGYKAYAEGDLAKASKINQEALARLNTAEAKTKEQSLPLVLSNLQRLGKVYESEEKKNVAQANEANAAAKRNLSQAELSSELSETERQLRDGRVKAQELSNKLSDISYQFSVRENNRDKLTNAYKVQAIIDECERAGIINEKMRQEIHGLVIDNNWKGVEKAMSAISQAVGSVSGIGNLAITETTMAQKLEIQRIAAENMRKPTETFTETQDLGNGTTQTYTNYRYY